MLHGLLMMSGDGSIQTALICSGFEGQKFTFHGYAPIDEQDCVRFFRELENTLSKTGYTQLFMETPYRNTRLIKIALKTLSNETYLSVASDLFGPNQFIKTLKIKEWKSKNIDLHKIPAVFGIGDYPD